VESAIFKLLAERVNGADTTHILREKKKKGRKK
jgi:hypothetical protein